eukprot:1597226-Pleurochrysis_carterae.AAC.10
MSPRRHFGSLHLCSHIHTLSLAHAAAYARTQATERPLPAAALRACSPPTRRAVRAAPGQ